MDAETLSALLGTQADAFQVMLLEHARRDINPKEVEKMVAKHGKCLNDIVRKAFTSSDSDSDEDLPVHTRPAAKQTTTTPRKRAAPSSPTSANKRASAAMITPTRSMMAPMYPAEGSSPGSGSLRANSGARMMKASGASTLFGGLGAATRAAGQKAPIKIHMDDSNGSLDSDNEATPRK